MHTYTPNEQKLLGILNELPTETSGIVAAHYLGRERPRFARESVVSVLNVLVEKVKKNQEPFRIKKTVRRGPHEMRWWIERRRQT